MTTYESAQEMQEQLSSREELSSRKRSMTLDLDNAGRPEHSSEEGCSSCLLTTPDLDKLQLTSPELEEFIMGFYSSETTPAPTTLFSLIEEEDHYPSGYAAWLPQLQLQQQEQTQQLPQPVFQQHVTPSLNVSGSGALASNTNIIVASSTNSSATGDYVDDKTQVVPPLGATPPELEELIKGLAQELLLTPPTLFSLIEEEEQYSSGCANWIPQLQRQQQEQTQQLPQPVLQQHVRPGPDVSGSGALTSNTNFIVPSSTKPSATGDYVEEKTQVVSALVSTPPEVGEVIKGLYAQELPLTPPTLFSLIEEEEQYSSGCADWLPQLQVQQQEHTEQPPQPMVTQNSVTGDYVKDKTQMVPAVDDTPPVWYISSDEDSSCGDSAPPTTMPEVPRQQSRHEEFSLRKRTVALDYDNGRPYQHYSKQARMLQKVPRPADEHPLSSINMLDREKTKIEEKRRRNRIAQKKCRQRQIDHNSQLQVRVSVLRTEIAWMKSRRSHLLHELHWLRQEVSMHVTQGCQI